MASDLVIVYHRQPYEEVVVDGRVEFRENTSPNGIVPTLKSFFGRAEQGAWIAWKLAEDPAAPDFPTSVEIDDSFGRYRVSRLPLTAAQVQSFYHVSSKAAFWPILHNFKEKYDYDPVDWPTFREVNWAFAEAAAREVSDDGIVWVHDYNLWLVPRYLRQMRPDVAIGFFHHTPFPGPDMFNVLPWRKEIVDSLLACDVIGFHVPRYAVNFLSVARSLFDVDVLERRAVAPELVSEGSALGERTKPVRIAFNGEEIALSASSVGVDVDHIERIVARDEVQSRAQEIRAERGDDAQLIISVGRTDYTKGGVEQLESFGRLLDANRELHKRVQLMHVSVPANRNMSAYVDVQADLEAAAGRINGRFGTLDWQPIALISRAIPFEELMPYYLAADICWITPLADGMNLVCKEFVATRTDGDGVLVLSEFAGAAVELGSAVLTNPFSHRSMDGAIALALEMPEAERRERMGALRQVVAGFPVAAWGDEQERLLHAARDRRRAQRAAAGDGSASGPGGDTATEPSGELSSA